MCELMELKKELSSLHNCRDALQNDARGPSSVQKQPCRELELASGGLGPHLGAGLQRGLGMYPRVPPWVPPLRDAGAPRH